jgi:hypothetical protein
MKSAQIKAGKHNHPCLLMTTDTILIAQLTKPLRNLIKASSLFKGAQANQAHQPTPSV